MTESTSSAPPVARIPVRPLTAESFAEFGSVVGRNRLVLTTTEFPFYTNLGTLLPADQPITYLNRHHDCNQLFLTLEGRPMVVIVASPKLSAAELTPDNVHAFLTDGNTAIVFHIDTWHLAPRGTGPEPVHVLNVQAEDSRTNTERIELADVFGGPIVVSLPA
jgi:ureidoglycolate hydrolase